MLLALAAGVGAQPPGEPTSPSAAPPERVRGAGRLFVSPMGEPFRQPDADNAALWFRGADRDGDGRLSRAECSADALRFFVTLDVNGDGEIDPDEIARYETEIVPETHTGGESFGGAEHGGGGRRGGGMGRMGGGGGGMGGGGMGGGRGGGMRGGSHAGASDAGGGGGERAMPREGAARFGYLDLPEPVAAADADMNRGVSRAEFASAAIRRCALLDTDGDGFVAASELPVRHGDATHARGRHRPPADGPDGG